MDTNQHRVKYGVHESDYGVLESEMEAGMQQLQTRLNVIHIREKVGFVQFNFLQRMILFYFL